MEMNSGLLHQRQTLTKETPHVYYRLYCLASVTVKLMVFLNVASCSTKFSDVHPVSIFTVMYIFHYIHFTYTGTAILRVWDSAWTYRVTSHWYELLRVTERTVVFDGESRWLDTSDSGHFELYMKREVPTDSLAVHFYGPK